MIFIIHIFFNVGIRFIFYFNLLRRKVLKFEIEGEFNNGINHEKVKKRVNNNIFPFTKIYY